MKLVFATHNENKLAEIRAMMPKNIELLSLMDIGCFKEIPETADTIEGNAKLKAEFVFKKYGLNCFADDTGLEVFSLENEPGVRSARYAGDHDSEANILKLLKNLEGNSDRSAQFKTAISLVTETSEELFLGICKGEITTSKKGSSGFGYDPIFRPEGFQKTFAEMSLEQKATIGHRGIAVRKLLEFLKE